jgi:negative regulator of flagellin synthesis FlgM
MDKVTNAVSGPVGVRRPGVDARETAASGPRLKVGGGVAALALSPLAAGTLAAEAPIDRGRIEAIRAAIANGDYPVDASAIARGMIALDLGD